MGQLDTIWVTLKKGGSPFMINTTDFDIKVYKKVELDADGQPNPPDAKVETKAKPDVEAKAKTDAEAPAKNDAK